MTLVERAPLVSFAVGAASITYGSIATLPRSTAGQIVVSVFIGAALVLFGALHLALLLARSPERADAVLEAALERTRLQRALPTFLSRVAFAEVPVLRWGLFAALLAVAIFAVAVLASDVFAWTRLGWAVPAGADRIILR